MPPKRKAQQGIPWFWGLSNNLVKSLHFPQALTRLLPGSRAREQAGKKAQQMGLDDAADLPPSLRSPCAAAVEQAVVDPPPSYREHSVDSEDGKDTAATVPGKMM
jgi:hypothetical protein